MYAPLVTAAIFFVALNTVEANSGVSCKQPAPVESFVASLVTALNVVYGSNVIQLDGGEAALDLFIVFKQYNDNHGICNGDYVAFNASNPVALLDKLTVQQYITAAAYAYSEAFYTQGLLNCQNAIRLAIELFTYVKKEFQKGQLDPKQFQSYPKGLVRGLTDFLAAHNSNFKTITPLIASNIVEQFNQLPKKVCQSSSS